MGRLVKNTVFKNGSYALGVPTGTSSVRPDQPVVGQTRFNTTTGKMEFYANVTGVIGWNNMASEGFANIQYTNFTANGSQSQFWPLKTTYNSGQENRVIVFVGGIPQVPITNYSFNGTANVLLTSIPTVSTIVSVVEGIGSTIATSA